MHFDPDCRVFVLINSHKIQLLSRSFFSNLICLTPFSQLQLGLTDSLTTAAHDRFRVDIYSAHELISITFAVFEYLDTTLATENKVLRFSKAVLPYKTRSSNVNLALILYFCGHTSYQRVT